MTRRVYCLNSLITVSIASCIACCIACLVVAAGARAGIGLPQGEYHLAYQGPETLTLQVVPDGSGGTLDQAFLPWGALADATLTVTLWDYDNNPIANFPREDIWLVSSDGGLVSCPGGTVADADTDAAGTTRWLAPPRAGGHSQALTVVLVNGGPIELTSGVALSYNSPDINGDLAVNLTDVQLFTADFFLGYDFRSDFHRDGTVNLSDLSVMARALGAACP